MNLFCLQPSFLSDFVCFLSRRAGSAFDVQPAGPARPSAPCPGAVLGRTKQAFQNHANAEEKIEIREKYQRGRINSKVRYILAFLYSF